MPHSFKAVFRSLNKITLYNESDIYSVVLSTPCIVATFSNCHIETILLSTNNIELEGQILD